MLECCKCKKLLDLCNFSRKSKSKRGYSSKCKACHRDYNREVWYVKNRDKQKLASSAYKKRNKFKVYARVYRGNPEEIRLAFEKSAGLCNICNCKTKLNLDHCHSTNKIRGFLCRSCNIGLGNFRDNVETLRAAIGYLEQYLKEHV